MIRILVVDDHPVVREGLVAILDDLPDFEVAGAAGSAEDAVAMARRSPPDLVLLDLELPTLAAAGRSNKQIARALGITERTVKFHIASIFGKLGTDNRAEAVAVAIRRGLLAS